MGRVPVQYNSNYCHPIYEVPRYPVVGNGHGGGIVNNGVSHHVGLNGHLTLSSQHTLGTLGDHANGLGGHHQHNIYEQGTLDSHLTAKIY